jgi:hypothetical protein
MGGRRDIGFGELKNLVILIFPFIRMLCHVYQHSNDA